MAPLTHDVNAWFRGCLLAFIWWVPSLLMAEDAAPAVTRNDEELIGILLEERLDRRTFAFGSVIRAASGKQVLPLQDSHPVHQRVRKALDVVLDDTLKSLNRQDSPIRKLRRINEASLFFEDELLTRLSKVDGLRCEIPRNTNGAEQRSGYPDLRILDESSGLVFYLDPKLVEQGSHESTFRTFYYEPRHSTGKIHDDAVHLLVGIEHDGKVGQWTFTGWRMVDLSTIRLRLKAEFQAANSELYRKTVLSTPPPAE